MGSGILSIVTLQRLPLYLRYLKALPKDEIQISSPSIAGALGLGEVLVRKDLASISDGGKPRKGYRVAELIDELEEVLGYKNASDAVIIGAGKLGMALFEYKGFMEYGLNIVAAFDADEAKYGAASANKSIFPLTKLEDLCKRLNIKIGIITVPAEAAQDTCDLLVRNGVLAIWNFAPTHLKAPEGILVQNENMASSLAVLAGHLTEAAQKNQSAKLKSGGQNYEQ